MRLLRTSGDRFTFHLGKREKPVLLAVLRRYPLIPPAHQSLSKSMTTAQHEADQRLLEEALAEQRRENRRQLEALLNDRRRLKDVETGCRLTLSAGEVDWLLQVLNDVRVGSWIHLGAPETDLWDFELNEQTAPHAWAMEMAGLFQMHLLEALRRGEVS